MIPAGGIEITNESHRDILLAAVLRILVGQGIILGERECGQGNHAATHTGARAPSPRAPNALRPRHPSAPDTWPDPCPHPPHAGPMAWVLRLHAACQAPPPPSRPVR